MAKKKAAKARKPAGNNSKKDPLAKDLYSILACPDCKKSVKYDAPKSNLVCAKCKAKFPIRDGIPIMLPNQLK